MCPAVIGVSHARVVRVGRIFHAGTGNVPRALSQSHPQSRRIRLHLICSGMAFAWLEPIGLGRGTLYSSRWGGFWVRAINAEKTQLTARLAAPVSTVTTIPYPILDFDRSAFTACPGTVRVPVVNQLCPLHWPRNTRNAAIRRSRISS